MLKIQATIIPEAEHHISSTAITPNALKVLNSLHKAGYSAYLVGGSVRDLLLGHKPKDFDIATDARPEQVRALFRNCRLIGRRFRLAHVFFGREIIEVATFRASQTEAPHDDLHHSQHGMILRDNVYGTLEEDALRRDFTINALYYNIADYSVVDYSNGVDDLHARYLRLIGEPTQRFREDPVRMLRAIRFAAKLNFTIHPDTAAPIMQMQSLLQHVPAARLFDEVLKLFSSGKSLVAFGLLRQYKLFEHLFLETHFCLEASNAALIEAFLLQAFSNTDLRIVSGKTVNPAFLLAVLLWHPFQHRLKALKTEGLSAFIASDQAARELFSLQLKQLSIPKRLLTMIREIWTLQYRLQQRTSKQANRLLTNPRFRAGYDFLLLRSAAGEDLSELANWWTEFQSADEKTKAELLEPFRKKPSHQRKKKSAPRKKNKTKTEKTPT